MPDSSAPPTADPSASAPSAPDDANADIREPRRWRSDGWTAQVLKNEDDDGWAVSMTRDGEAEPALVGPWTMGRDKKNPKPLDGPAFSTLVKTASEVLRRHEQQLHATLHRHIAVEVAGVRYDVAFDIVPDEDNPSATLSATDASGTLRGHAAVPPNFRFGRAAVAGWIEAGFPRLSGG